MRLESGGLLGGGESDMHPVEQAIRALLSDDSTAKVDALLAVLDLHKPDLIGGDWDCHHCRDNSGLNTEYPCGTVERIADALGVTP